MPMMMRGMMYMAMDRNSWKAAWLVSDHVGEHDVSKIVKSGLRSVDETSSTISWNKNVCDELGCWVGVAP